MAKPNPNGTKRTKRHIITDALKLAASTYTADAQIQACAPQSDKDVQDRVELARALERRAREALDLAQELESGVRFIELVDNGD